MSRKYELRRCFEEVDQIKEEEDDIRREIKRVTKEQIDQNTSTQLTLFPVLQRNYGALKDHMHIQKNLNDKYSKDLMELRKELLEMMTNSAANMKRFGMLEGEAGVQTGEVPDESGLLD